ncbi:hypothetical protein QLR68_27585, partial [Micromonospora sp. DH15]|nr:hypothetical protein [Micromonospora sp. DH15]
MDKTESLLTLPPPASTGPTPTDATAAAGPPARGRRDPAWVRPALAALLLATALLYLWGLGASGWANS